VRLDAGSSKDIPEPCSVGLGWSRDLALWSGLRPLRSSGLSPGSGSRLSDTVLGNGLHERGNVSELLVVCPKADQPGLLHRGSLQLWYDLVACV